MVKSIPSAGNVNRMNPEPGLRLICSDSLDRIFPIITPRFHPAMFDNTLEILVLTAVRWRRPHEDGYRALADDAA
jgi:hypothetical protein